MPTITLLAKAYGNSQLKHVDRLLKSKVEGLKVQIQVKGVTSRGWVQIELSGEDERVATHFLADEIGICPTSLEQVQKFSTLRGRIVELNESKDELRLDIGVFQPEVVDATLPVQRLQAQLADGRRATLRRIAELFGFHDNLLLTIKVSDLSKDKKQVEAMLTEKQVRTYEKWTASLLDRLIILGASSSEVKAALEKSRLERDVVDVEPLGLFEYAIVCKLGTDAVGLIPVVGRALRDASFAVFSPRRIRDFLEEKVMA
jgi:hypothetical protein